MVTTFNQPLILEHVLCSLDKQTIHAAQIVVADTLESLAAAILFTGGGTISSVTLCVACPNDNFRASRIRNLAVLKAKGNHLIFKVCIAGSSGKLYRVSPKTGPAWLGCLGWRPPISGGRRKFWRAV